MSDSDGNADKTDSPDLLEEGKAFLDPEKLMELGENALILIVILIVATIIGSILAGAMRRTLDGAKRQPSSLLKAFVVSWTKRITVILGLVVGLETIGIRTAPIIAGLGIFGFVLGFAVQGTLSNFASGMMLLIYQPFDEGDVVELGGTIGKVKELTIVNTTMTTADNRLVILPNNTVWGSQITNLTKLDTRRVDMVASVAYDTDLNHCRHLLLDLLNAQEETLDEPETMVEVLNFGDNAIDFTLRPWVKTENFWPFFFKMQREIKVLLDKEGIDIPFPQRVVHLVGEDKPDAA